MKEKFSPSKVLLIAAAVMSFAVAGCERRAADQSSGASGSSGASSGAAGSSSPGGAGASGGASPGSK